MIKYTVVSKTFDNEYYNTTGRNRYYAVNYIHCKTLEEAKRVQEKELIDGSCIADIEEGCWERDKFAYPEEMVNA